MTRDQVMKRYFPIFLPCVIAMSLNAQSWCPENATWWHAYQDMVGTVGYARTDYTGDTLIDGMNCHRLVSSIRAWSIPEEYLYVSAPWTRHTSVQGDVVLLQDYNNTFDTLYNFAAVPGEHWFVPFANAVRYLVTDTGSTTIDGIGLRWLSVDVLMSLEGGEWTYAQDTLLERVGFLHQFIDPSNSLSIEPDITQLRCYQDDELAFSSGISPTCEHTLGVGRIDTRAILLQVFPNPAQRELRVELPHTLDRDRLGYMVVDALGRTAQVGLFKVDPSVVRMDVSGLSSGSYYMFLTDNERIVGRTTFQVVH